MRIDMEQFLAMTVALGTVGALGVAVYSTRPDVQGVLGSLGNADPTEAAASERDAAGSPGSEAKEPEPTVVPIPIPIFAEPTEISPVVPEPETESVPGPDIETANW